MDKMIADLSAKVDIVEKKLQRSEELLESARGMSDQRGAKLITIRHQLHSLNVLLREKSIDDSDVLKVLTELNEVAR